MFQIPIYQTSDVSCMLHLASIVVKVCGKDTSPSERRCRRSMNSSALDSSTLHLLHIPRQEADPSGPPAKTNTITKTKCDFYYHTNPNPRIRAREAVTLVPLLAAESAWVLVLLENPLLKQVLSQHC